MLTQRKHVCRRRWLTRREANVSKKKYNHTFRRNREYFHVTSSGAFANRKKYSNCVNVAMSILFLFYPCWRFCSPEPVLGPSLLFSPSVVFDFLRPHGLQHARLSCPSLAPRVSSMSIESLMPSNCLILCHHLLILPSVFPSASI